MIITTTNTIDGTRIEQYIGPVSSHVVLGVNIFSDIAAGWRDVFGGRSKSYQKQLQRLTDVALGELQEAAKGKRGNAIVGMRLDYSDISGGGKSSMLMVVATGTAIVIPNPDEDSNSNGARIVDREIVNQYLKKKKAIDDFDVIFSVDSILLTQLTESRVHELYQSIIDKYPDSIAYFESEFLDYYAMCVEELGYEWGLKDVLTQHPKKHINKAIRLIVSLHDFRLADLIPYVSNNDINPVNLLQLASNQQPFYTEADFDGISELSRLLAERFPITTRTEVVKSLTGKRKNVEYCACGGKIDDRIGTCNKCGKDRWGFDDRSVTPADTISKLDNLALALQLAFTKTT